MLKNFKKLAKNKSGFTLTEVLIGIMILTVAIVSATNLLVGLLRTNKNIVLTMKAYYLAQEGIEAVRNIRDTNWLNNIDFKGDGEVYPVFEEGSSYAVFLRNEGWNRSDVQENLSKNDLRLNYLPWKVEKIGDVDDVDPYGNGFALGVNEDSGREYYSNGPAVESAFYRHVDILDPCEEVVCDDFILVRSVVNWHDGSRERNFVLETVLSDWKGGAL